MADEVLHIPMTPIPHPLVPILEPACSVCRDTGIVQCPDPDRESLYETACPEPVHDGQDVTFPADSTPGTSLSDWDW